MDKPNGNPTTKTNEQPSAVLQLTVLWDQVTGAVQVTGPIQNHVIAIGMLDAAKDAIHEFHKKAAEDSRIVAPGGFPVNIQTRKVS